MYSFFLLPYKLRALRFSSQNCKRIRIYAVRATFSTLPAPKLCRIFFFSRTCYVLYAFRPKIVNAFVFMPYALRSLHFLPQNYLQLFFPYMLRALRCSSQNYKRIPVSPVRATYCAFLAFMYLTPWCCCMKTKETLTDLLGSPLRYAFLRPVYTRFSILYPPTHALCTPVMTLPVTTEFAVG